VDVALRHAVAGKDCLLLARVVEEVKPDPAIVLLDILCEDEEQIRVEEEAKKKLEVFTKQCMNAGVDCAHMVLVDDHAGSALCKAAAVHNVECMIVGRRDIGAFQRFLSFSTSKYCFDNAECNVIVVKKPYSAETVEVNQQGNIIAKEEKEVRQIATEHPPLFTLRNPNEMKKRIMQITPEKKEALTELTRVEELERASRLPDLESELAQERSERNAQRELVRSLEEQERAERVQKANGDDEVERKVRLQESKYNLALTKKLEEEERQARIAEMKKGASDSNKDSRKNLVQVKKLEEEERNSRVQIWKEEEREVQEERRKESERDRKLVAKLEEQERALRLADERKLIVKEKKTQSKRRAINLGKIHFAEEQERAERVRVLHEEEVREQVVADVQSQKDRKLARQMETEEQERRMREDEVIKRTRESESKLDLLRVKELEEIERAERVKTMKPLRKPLKAQE